MKIRKGSALYKWLYWYRPESNIPKQENLCKLFWLTMAHMLINPVFFTLAFIGLSLVAIYAFVFEAKRLPWFKSDQNQFTVPIKRYPRIKGRTLMPYQLLLICFGVWLGFKYGPYLIDSVSRFGHTTGKVMLVDRIDWTGTLWVYLNLTAIVAVAALLRFVWQRWLKDSQLIELIRGYGHALKERACPIVEIEHSPPTDKPTTS